MSEICRVMTGLNAGNNVKIVGYKDDQWLVQLLVGNTKRFPVSHTNLRWIPEEWKRKARPYEPQRLMKFFNAPGQLDPVPEAWGMRQAVNARQPPSISDTVAFWGDNAFPYMLKASLNHSYNREKYTNNAFLNGRIYAGVIWSDCNPNTDTIVINFETTCSFQWWPALISICLSGETYAKCQDFVFTGGRPRAIDKSRCHFFHQMHGPRMLTRVLEDFICPQNSDGDESTTTGDCTSIAVSSSITHTSDAISSTSMSSLGEILDSTSIAWPSITSDTSDGISTRSSSPPISWEIVN